MRFSSAARRSGVAKLPPSISRDQIMSANPREAAITSSIAARPPARARSSGSWPSGNSAKRRLLPGRRCGSAEIGGAPRRLLTGAIAVKTKDRLVGHLPEQRELVFGQRRAERRDARRIPHADHGDHVDIAFDHHDRTAVMGRLPRGAEIVEMVALVKQRRFRRIQIFRRHVLLERAAAKRNHAAPHIGDRKHHAVAEAIIGHRNIVAADQKTGLDHILDRDALRAEMFLQREAVAAAHSRGGTATCVAGEIARSAR